MIEMTLKRAIKLVWMHHYKLTMSREDEADVHNAYFYLGDVANTEIDFPFMDSVVTNVRREHALKPKGECPLHGELAEDGLCDVCEGRGLWEGD